MINWQDIDTDVAEEAFLVANTPRYLASRLRSMTAAVTLATQCTSDELMREVVSRLSVESSSPRERMMPFICVAALSLKQDRASLSRLHDQPKPHHRWLNEVIEIFLERTASYQTLSFQIPAMVKLVAPTFNHGLPSSGRVVISV